MSYVFKSGEFTSVGRNPKRPINEDFVGKYEPHDDPTLAERGYLYVVADGMGGHAAGEVASRYAVEKVLYEYYNGEWIDPATNLQRAIEMANRDVYEESLQNPTREEMGTTIVAAVLRDDGELTIAHVGDSRAYLARDGEIRQLTRDHSRVQEDLDRGVLTEADIPHHRERHVLTQSIGGDADVRVELTFETMQADDYLLLCTDGVWGVLGAEGMVRAVQRIRQPGLAARAIVEQVDHLGGPDNSTVCLIRAVPAVSEEATVVTEEEDPTVDIPEAPRFDASPEVRTISPPEVQKPWPGDIRLIASGLAVALIVVVAGLKVIADRGAGAPGSTAETPNPAPQVQSASSTSAEMTATVPAGTPTLRPTSMPTPTETLTSTIAPVSAATAVTPATQVPPSTFAFRYRVQPGDTLDDLARRFNTTVDKIMRANDVVDFPPRLAGQILLIPGCQDLIANGGFESHVDSDLAPDDWNLYQAIWTKRDNTIVAEDNAHSGDWAMFLGLLEDDDDTTRTTEVAQLVPLPANVPRIWLRFWYYTMSKDTAGDTQFVHFRTKSGATIRSFDWQPTTPEIAGQWREEERDVTSELAPYSNTSVRLVFGVTNDGDGQGKTYMRIDDVSLVVCGSEIERVP